MTSSGQVQDIPRVPEVINLSSEEEKVLALWNKINAFQTSLKQSKGRPRYSFYDGPPFATGLPHYGHILTGTIKDVVTRYAHQKGYHVERRFGWDTHGLPVEFEIDKTLGIKGPADVEKMGIAAYNSECRKIVTRYVKEWEMIIGRIGRWIDFKNDYKSLYPWFMESVWWVFKQLYNKGLVYQGSKVMPYSPTCNTPLSNFESGQNYKDVVDPAVTVSLPIIGDKEGAALLIWTTTPWTLPSNLTACVNAKLVYARVQELSTKRIFILLESRVEYVFKPDEYKVLKTFPGEKLRGLKYKPIFGYFKHFSEVGAFTVLVDDYVTAESGTGVVHQAPYFGEDDYRVCLAAGVISRDQDPICPVDASGCFTKPVTDFEGQYFKDADKNIVATLKADGRLIQHSQVKHSYPFCWRSDTPLMYKAVRSWFIRVESMSQELQRATSATYWIPEFVRDKRFGNWLKEARDWAVSRNRYWGTPIPLWVSPSGDEIVCVGSIAELEELTGVKVTDLHRESIDHLEIPSRIPGNPPLKRVPEVFDCWFESGSMPFAQEHYPFENTKEFEEHFPADFIAEGIDQTRGWFYTLIVISTLLFGQAPFKNLVANGLILASDGQKMSKRKKNYPDPLEIINKYGADALRLYLINSPVVRAENLRFKEDGVRDIVKDVFLPWFNAFRFLMQNIEVYVQENNTPFHYSNEQQLLSENIMDKWIVSFTQSLLAYVYKEMELYHLYNVIPCLTKYIDQLTNWYVRMNRKRLKGEGGPEDCKHALTTLFNVLFTMVKIMAPFSPFLSETIFQYLRKLTDINSDSVHYLMLPQSDSNLINKTIERAISRMQAVIELGRVLRDRKTVPIKYPLPEIVVIHQSDEYIEDVKSLESYVLLEMNVRKLTVTTDKSRYGIALRAEPDHKTLGLRLKQEFKAVASAIKTLTNHEINDMAVRGYRDICGQRIQISEIRLMFQTDVNSSKYEVHSDNDVLVLLDMTPDSSMQDEGTAREIINRIQKLRKKAHLVPTDEISVYYKATGDLNRVALSHKEFIETTIKASFQPHDKLNATQGIIIDEQQSFKDCDLKLVIIKKGASENVQLPKVKWVNILLHDIPWSRYGCPSNKALILLEVGGHMLSVKQLKDEIAGIFGIGSDFDLWYPKGIIADDNVLSKLSGNTIVASKNSFKGWDNGISGNSQPFCNVANFVCDGVEGTIILENPSGVVNVRDGDRQALIKQWVKYHTNNKKIG